MTETAYQVTIDDRVVRVQLRRTEAGCFVRVDGGDEQRVDLGASHGSVYWLAVDDRRAELLAAAADDQVTLTIAGLEHRAEVVDEARARLASVAGGRAAAHARRELRAPMPGLLVRLLCQPGDTVEPGQPLAVLQAMKMENELSLSRGGTITAVQAQAGQTVEQGQVLVVVE
jgi:propionyl-CoA carboxylase alpha chain